MIKIGNKCILNKVNFNPLEKIRGKIEYKEKLKSEKMSFVLVQVFDWYDQTINLNGNGIVENGYLSFEIFDYQLQYFQNILQIFAFSFFKVQGCRKQQP